MQTFFGRAVGSSIRMQLILGVAAVHLLLMSIFVFDLTQRQKAFLNEKSINETQFQIMVLASSSKEYLRTNDLIGLQEILNTYLEDHEISFAMIVAPDGRVLSHSDENLRGLYLQDTMSLSIVRGPHTVRQIIFPDEKIEFVAPITEGKTLLGWVRIASDFSENQTHIDYVTRQGLLYTAAAILIGTLFAFGLSGIVLRQLSLLMTGADRLGKHQLNDPIPIVANNEIGTVSKAFNDAMKKIEQQEIAVGESDSRYRLLAENISDVIWIFDLESRRFKYISPSVQQLRGFTVEEAMNQKFEDALTESSLQKLNDNLPDRIQQFLKNGPQSHTDIVEQRCKDGSTVWVEIKTRFIKNESTGKIEVYGVSRNVTDRLITEEKLMISDENLRASNTYLQSLINSNTSYLIRTDMEGRYTYVNEPFIRKFGFSREELIGKSGTISIYSDDIEKMMQTVTECIKAPGQAFPVELRKYNVQGEIFFTHWEFILTNNAEGKPESIQCVGYDITARKKMEEALRDSEGRWKTLVTTLPDYIALHDIEGRYLFLNHYAEGFSEKDVVGRSLFDFLNDESKSVYRQHFETCIQTKQNQQFTYSAYGENGTVKIYEGYLVPLLEKGRVVNVLSVAKDITETQRIEHALRASEDKFSKAFYTSPDAVNITRLSDGMYLDVNTGFTAMSGYTPEEVVNKTSLELNIWNDPSDRERLIQGLKEKGEVSNLEAVFRLKNDRLITGLMSARIMEINGEQCLLSITRDISDRKQINEALRESEQKYRGLVENSPDAIAIYVEGRVVFANNQCAVLMAVQSKEELLGRSVIEFVHPDNRSRVIERMKQVAVDGKTLPTEEEKFIRYDGTSIDVEVKAIPTMFENKPAVQIIVHDITERKRMEAALRESEEIFNQLMEHSPIYVFFKDENIRATRLSRNFETMIGRPIPELLGKNMYEMFPSELAKNIVADDMRILNEGKRVEVEEEFNGKSYLTIKFPINIEGKPRYLAGFTIDITERKRAEEALRLSEQTYRGILDSVTEAVYIESPEGKFLDVNRAAEKMYGYTKEEIVGQTPEFLSAPGKNDLSKLGPLMEKALNGEPQTFEFWGRRKDGTIFPKDVSNSLGYYFGEKVNIAVARDITERKQSEEKLHQLSQAVEQNPVTIIITDISGSIEYVNQKFVEVTGYSVNEVIGKKPSMLKSGHTSPEEYDQLWKTLLSGEEWHGEFHNRKKNGTLYWESATISPIVNAQKEITHYLAIKEDITARKNAQKELIAAKENYKKASSLKNAILESPLGIIIFALDTNYRYIEFTPLHKETMKTIWGTEIQIGDNMLDHISNVNDRANAKKNFDRALRGDKFTVHEEYGDETLQRMHYEDIYSPIIDENNIIMGLSVFVIDITERKKSEQIIRDVQRRESIGVLAGGIAHDFNNLLSAMMGNISLAQSRMSPDHPAIKNIERALLAMERAATLTKQMLAYSGKGKFQMREIDLVALVQEHINLFEVSLPKNVQLVSNLSSTPVFIKGDPAQIEQIVMNLIINGGEAIGKKQGFVSIEVTAVTMLQHDLAPYSTLTNNILPPGSYALLQVTDNGSGMSKETQTKIFDPFFTTKFVGRGLGLSAVLGIIRGNEGGIAIETEEGLGTTFRVLLPLIESSDADKVLTNTVNDASIIENIKVLVIDDEQYVVEMAVDILEFGKYLHLSATDPEKGISLYKDQWRTVDVVILDYSMPKMNGKEVFSELRKINPEVKVIISSGYTEEEIFELMGDDTPNAFIQKPYTQENLLSIVKRILESA